MLRWLPAICGALLVFFALRHQPKTAALRRCEYAFLTMGTQAAVKADWPLSRREDFAGLMKEMEQRVRRVERLLSRFDPESDVSRFNAARAGEMVAVDPLTWEVAMTAARVNALSGGAFDPTVLPVLELYDWKKTDAGDFPGDDAVKAARALTGMDKIIWQRDGMKMGKTVDGVRLDFGGVAKGLGVDVAADFLRRNGVKDAVVDIGGEQRLLGRASGRDESVEHRSPASGADAGKAGNPAGTPWASGIRAPRDAAGRPAPRDGAGRPLLAEVLRPVGDCAIATSGDYEQYFMWQGKQYSHIVDPRTGRPLCGGVISASIVFPGDCMTADALATAVSVLGEKGARALLRHFPSASAWLIVDDGKAGKMVHIPAADGTVAATAGT